jgi:hypothetical protein
MALNPVNEWLCVTVLLYNMYWDIIACYYWPSAFNIECMRNILCQSNANVFYCAISETLNGLWTVLSNIQWISCGQYWAISSKYSVGTIERYPSNILWTVLRNIHCMVAILHNMLLLWTLLRYIHCIMWTILRNVYSKLVENENFISSKAFPLSK